MVEQLRKRRGLLALFVALALAFLVRAAWPTGGEPVPPVASSASAVMLLRADLDAEALAAAGVGTPATTESCNDAEAYVAASPTALSSADSDFAEHKVQRDKLQRKIRSGLGSTQDVTDYQTHLSAFNTAKSDREAALDGIFDAGIADLTAAQKTTLQTIRANRVWDLPAQYLVVNRTQAEWVELRDALDARRIQNDAGEPLEQEVIDLLADVEGVLAVSAAKVNLDTNHAAVQTAWNTAVSD